MKFINLLVKSLLFFVIISASISTETTTAKLLNKHSTKKAKGLSKNHHMKSNRDGSSLTAKALITDNPSHKKGGSALTSTTKFEMTPQNTATRKSGSELTSGNQKPLEPTSVGISAPASHSTQLNASPSSSNEISSSSSTSTHLVKKSPEKRDFFHKTSKSNENVALKALGAFVGGIILFICSIHVICYNERQSVKFTEFIDYISDEKSTFYASNGEKVPNINSHKYFIVTGRLKQDENAAIPELDFQLESENRRIVSIKYDVQKQKTYQSTDTEEVERDGETYEKTTVHTDKYWVEDTGNGESKGLQQQIFRAKGLTIGGNYTFDFKKMDKLIESNQDICASRNKYAYFFKPTTDHDKLKNYISKSLNKDATFKLLFKENKAYVILHNPDGITQDTFNDETYTFHEDDRRIMIKYVYIYLK